jgi:hypothetical protein
MTKQGPKPFAAGVHRWKRVLKRKRQMMWTCGSVSEWKFWVKQVPVVFNELAAGYSVNTSFQSISLSVDNRRETSSEGPSWQGTHCRTIPGCQAIQKSFNRRPVIPT